MSTLKTRIPLYVVGIDVGGTNTDAVLLQFEEGSAPSNATFVSTLLSSDKERVRLAGERSASLLASVKVPTTACFTGGIHNALVVLLRSLRLHCCREKSQETDGAESVDAKEAEVGDERNDLAVMIGTTVFLNALLQAGASDSDAHTSSGQPEWRHESHESGNQLGRVVCVRLCGPLTRGLPPFTEFPTGLAAAMNGPVYFVDGGFEFDRQTVKSLDELALRAIGEDLVLQSKSMSGSERPNALVNVAITGVFSPLYCEQEVRAAEIIGEVLRAAGVEHSITLSHRIGNLSFLERENATILNAALRPLARRTIRDLRQTLEELGLVNALLHVYLTQNDGTVFSLEEALEYPILTLNSGPSTQFAGLPHFQSTEFEMHWWRTSAAPLLT